MIDPTQQQPDPSQAQPVGVAPAGPPAPQAAPLPASGLPSMPAGLGQPPRQPSTPPPNLPHITPDTPPEHLPQEPRLEDLTNPFERRGLLLAQAVRDEGRRISDAMPDQPTGAQKQTDQELRANWRYSPNGTDEAANNALFYQVHDQTLAQTGDPTQAEQVAIATVFPYRAPLTGMGITQQMASIFPYASGPRPALASAERQVELAEHIRKVVDGAYAPPESRPVAIARHATNEGYTA